MKSFWKFLLVVLFTQIPVVADDLVNKVQTLLLEEFSEGGGKMLGIGILPEDGSFLKFDNLVVLSAADTALFQSLFEKMHWHDSIQVATRDTPEFVVIIESRSGSLFGLHSRNSIEFDCFTFVGLAKEDGKFRIDNHVEIFKYSKKNDTKIEARLRVLRIPGWTSSDIGTKVLRKVSSGG